MERGVATVGKKRRKAIDLRAVTVHLTNADRLAASLSYP